MRGIWEVEEVYARYAVPNGTSRAHAPLLSCTRRMSTHQLWSSQESLESGPCQPPPASNGHHHRPRPYRLGFRV
jgi:hypothetical protein